MRVEHARGGSHTKNQRGKALARIPGKTVNCRAWAANGDALRQKTGGSGKKMQALQPMWTDSKQGFIDRQHYKMSKV
jgi:hypothetical protein